MTNKPPGCKKSDKCIFIDGHNGDCQTDWEFIKAFIIVILVYVLVIYIFSKIIYFLIPTLEIFLEY